MQTCVKKDDVDNVILYKHVVWFHNKSIIEKNTVKFLWILIWNDFFPVICPMKHEKVHFIFVYLLFPNWIKK